MDVGHGRVIEPEPLDVAEVLREKKVGANCGISYPPYPSVMLTATEVEDTIEM